MLSNLSYHVKIVTLLVIHHASLFVVSISAVLAPDRRVSVVACLHETLELHLLLVPQMEESLSHAECVVSQLLADAVAAQIDEPAASEGLHDVLTDPDKVIRRRVSHLQTCRGSAKASHT